MIDGWAATSGDRAASWRSCRRVTTADDSGVDLVHLAGDLGQPITSGRDDVRNDAKLRHPFRFARSAAANK
jgi:hypothetical protein